MKLTFSNKGWSLYLFIFLNDNTYFFNYFFLDDLIDIFHIGNIMETNRIIIMTLPIIIIALLVG